MPELISHPGLRFYVFALEGSLTYSLARNGRVPTTYKIFDFDIEDASGGNNNGALECVNTESGTDVSAVGCHLYLVKNDGSLKVEFEGPYGSAAKWSFDGLTTTDGAMMVATAATQTYADPNQRSACGRDIMAEVEVKHQETQSDMIAMHSAGVEMMTGVATTSTGIQTIPTSEPSLLRQSPQAAQILGPFVNAPAIEGLAYKASRDLTYQFLASRKILDRDPKVGESVEALKSLLKEERESRSVKAKQTATSITQHVQPKAIDGSISISSSQVGTQTESKRAAASSTSHPLVEQSATSANNLKRKASSSPSLAAPLHKCAKSKHNSSAWPRHLYMQCYRTFPMSKEDMGILHIDVETATVWFEWWHGRPHNLVFERKQCDLRDPYTKIVYNSVHSGVDGATKSLGLARPNVKGGITRIFGAHCAAPGWNIWGSDECWEEGSNMTPLPSARVLIDAIVHCIDVTSCRQAVLDPDALHLLHEDDAQFQKSKDACTLTQLDMLDWEFTPNELKSRETRRCNVVLCDIEAEDDKAGRENAVTTAGAGGSPESIASVSSDVNVGDYMKGKAKGLVLQSD
ncbi:hypothetical protein DE146DRAFT_753847 [Phaeosphaeria sp. MPI-PUGE-AT-0046c]|nr:hypothetical protein DE146DRAFT_753847 [Phaeosphaeria sp. MPI-PUGE-AT-0046c]